MNKKFEILALNADFEIVSLLRYTNLQWSRKWYSSGTFSVEIPLDQYQSEFRYIYTKDRQELGEISQINYKNQNGYNSISLSGYFLEEELNRRVAYAKSTSTNITNEPSWVHFSGKAENVAYAYFNAFKDVKFTQNSTTITSSLGIEAGTSEGRGNDSDHERANEYLGDKIHTILKPSEMSYRVKYDFNTNKKVFECLKGKDLTQDNSELNNPVIFSTAYGNLQNADVVLSSSAYKNSYIAVNQYTENDTNIVQVRAGKEGEEASTLFQYTGSSVNHSDYSTTADYIKAIETDGHISLQEKQKTISIVFDASEGSYNYMEDFDIGDKCSLEIKEMGLSADAVLIGCYEVIKKGVHTLELEFDTPELKTGGI